MILQQPLQVANRDGQYDIVVTVAGGGLSGQAGAVRHGLAKALTYYEPELRGPLKKEGFLTRDSARRRAQEVRQEESPPQLPVLEALSSFSSYGFEKGGSRAALFRCAVVPRTRRRSEALPPLYWRWHPWKIAKRSRRNSATP